MAGVQAPRGKNIFPHSTGTPKSCFFNTFTLNLALKHFCTFDSYHYSSSGSQGFFYISWFILQCFYCFISSGVRFWVNAWSEAALRGDSRLWSQMINTITSLYKIFVFFFFLMNAHTRTRTTDATICLYIDHDVEPVNWLSFICWKSLELIIFSSSPSVGFKSQLNEWMCKRQLEHIYKPIGSNLMILFHLLPLRMAPKSVTSEWKAHQNHGPHLQNQAHRSCLVTCSAEPQLREDYPCMASASA